MGEGILGLGGALSGVTPNLAIAGAILRCTCGRPLTGRGRQFCSRKCKDREYNRTHPVTRQSSLEFAAVERVKPAPATGEPYESARLWLLGRLQSGPVSTLELRCPPWRASQNPAQRVLELRNRQHDIRTVRLGSRTWYWLHVDGMPIGVVPEGAA
jgi:hypothetical protein